MLTDPQSEPSFWYAVPYGERYKDALQPDRESRDLRTELGNGPIGCGWRPPAYAIRDGKLRGGKTWPWPDWMSFYWPLLSKRAIDVLRDLLEPHCELLPWISKDGHDYTLLNILTAIPAAQWTCGKQTRWGDAFISADIISVQVARMPHMFILEGYRGKQFVSDALARRSYDSGLKGVAFIDPRIPAMHLPFIRMQFGTKGTGFIHLREDPSAEPITV